MNGFWGTTAKTDEEYRRVIKKRTVFYGALIIFGAATAVTGFCAESFGNTKISEQMLGVYTGAGTGLFLAGIIFLIKSLLLMKNERKLKENRLKNTDERNQAICKKALSVATFCMIAVLYAVALIGGLFYPILVEALLLVMCAFLVSYVIAFKIYSTKM